MITVSWKDYRQMCAVKFLKLEDFLDDERHGLALDLEPKGLLFAEVRYRTSLMLNSNSNAWSLFTRCVFTNL